MTQKRDSSEPQWEIKVTFVPFKSGIDRDCAYRTWARLFLRAKEREIRERKKEPGEKESLSECAEV